MEGLQPMEWRRNLVIERTDCGDSLKQKTVDAGTRDRGRRKKRRVAQRLESEIVESSGFRHVIDVTL
jgi:hypothetical protein